MKKKEIQIMDASGIDWALNRIAHEIIERNRGIENLVIVGIKSRGDILANRLAKKISAIEKTKIPVGGMDITFYRDDVHLQAYKHTAKGAHLPFNVEEKKVILVDDVLFTGRSVRAAIDEIVDFGRPRLVQLAVLIDRGGRELPIQPDYVGKQISTLPNEKIILYLKEAQKKDCVVIETS